MKYFKLQLFVIILMIMGPCSGAYASAVQDNNSISASLDGVKTIYVANNGTDRNDGLTPENPKRNIENALKAANSGDTIILAPGTYQKNVRIDKSITLSGRDQNNTIIDGQRANNCIYI